MQQDDYPHSLPAAYFGTTDELGNYSIMLPTGVFEAEIATSTLPAGFVNPGVVDIEIDQSPAMLNWQLQVAAANVSGTVMVDGFGSEAEVIAFDMSGNEVSFAYTDFDGNYSMDLPAGDHVLVADLDGSHSHSSLVAPDPMQLTIAVGIDQTGINFDYLTPTSMNSTELPGRILVGGSPASGEVEFRKLIAGQYFEYSFVNTFFGSNGEEWTAYLPDGDYEVDVVGLNGNDYDGFDAVEITVAFGTVLLAGQPVTGSLDLVIDNGALTGTILDGFGMGLGFANVNVTPVDDPTAVPTSTTTNADGDFVVSGLNGGTYWVQLDMSTLPGMAQPRARMLQVDGTGLQLSPSVMNFGTGASGHAISGNVTIDGLPVTAQVYAFDAAMHVVATTTTDGAGAYQFNLAEGNYSIVAQLDSPVGDEVAPLLSPVALDQPATRDIPFTTTASATLAGLASIDGAASELPILVTTTLTGVTMPLAMVTPMASGDYQIPLEDGTYDVNFWSTLLPAGVATEPVTITVSGATISGTDGNGAAIAANTLDLDPFGASDAGAVRQVASDMINAILAGDAAALTALLHPTTLWWGMSASEVVTDFSSESEWGDPTRRFDEIVVETMQVNSDEWTVWFRTLHQFRNAGDGTAREEFWDSNITDSTRLLFTVKRDSSLDPWMFAGNGQNVDQVAVGQCVEVRNIGGVDGTPTAEVEFLAEESEGSLLSIVSSNVSGAGITDGTMTQDLDEWFAFVDDGNNAGPSPFDADYGSLVDGGSYTFIVDMSNAAVDVLPFTFNAAVPGLVPTATLTQTSSGGLLVQWEDISAQLNNPLRELCVTLVEDPDGVENEVMDECGLANGATWLVVDGAMMQSGSDYEVCVEYIDAGGALQTYCYNFSWPFQGAIVSGSVSSTVSGALNNVDVVAMDSFGFTEVARATTNSMGDYSLNLDLGDYILRLENLPAGSVSPAEVDVVVESGGSGLDVYINGQLTSTYDFMVQEAVARLTGQVTLSGTPTSGHVVAFSGTTIVAEAPADMTTGDYELYLPEGDVSVIAELSTGTGMVLPAPFIMTLSNTGSIQDFVHDFDFVTQGPTDQMLSGQVYLDGSLLDSDVLVMDDNDNVFGLTEAIGGFFSVTLTAGTYFVGVDPSFLPPGFVGATGFDIEVTPNGITGPGVDDNGGLFSMVIQLNSLGSMLSGTVTDPAGTPLEGIVLTIEADEVGGPSLLPDPIVVTDQNGQYAIMLADNFYEVVLEPQYVPTTFVSPTDFEVDIQGSPVVLDIQLEAADATISGSVMVNGAAPLEEAEIVVYDASGDEVTWAITDANGDYTLGVANGAYTLTCDLEDQDLSMVVTPDPTAVTVAGVDLTGVDFDFVAVSGGNATVFSGRVTAGGQSLSADLEISKDIGGTMMPFAAPYTMFNGVDHEFMIALTDGMYEVTIDWAEGQDVSNFTPVMLVVSAGTITADGQVLPNNDIELNLDVAELVGYVFADGGPVSGANVVATPFDGSPDVTVVSGADGDFTFDSLVDGGYWISIDSASVPANGALPRQQTLHVSSEGYAPSLMILSVPEAAGDLSGVVSVNGTGAAGEVMILDGALRPVATVDTDPSGNYSAALAEGDYTVVAILETPQGMHPDLGLINVTANTTVNIDFDAVTSSTTLSGLVRFNSIPLQSPVIVTTTSGQVAMAMAHPGPTGDYTFELADGDYEVMAWPEMLDIGQIAAPVTINVNAGTVTGTDLEGVAISANTLNIEPYGASDQGQIRSLLADFVTAITDGDDVLLEMVLDDNNTIMNGLDETAYIADEMSSSDWGAFGNRNDHIVGTLEQIGADEWHVTARSGRNFRLESDGFGNEEAWDTRSNNTADYTLVVMRDNGASPWQIAGNGVYYDEIWLENIAGRIVDSLGASTDEDEVEFGVEEGGEPITSATVAGTGVTNGTLFQEINGSDIEWFGFIDDLGGGPSPFAGDFSMLVDGGTYTFTVDFSTAAQAVVPLQMNAPVTGLFPTAELATLGGTEVMISWEDILARLDRPVAEVELDLTWDNGGTDIDIWSSDGVPFGTSHLLVDQNLFQSGESYILSVEVFDTGGGVQAFELEFDWPLQQP
ncbi:MAG: carboxypeptidase-like regulatory domain-containing protein [Planctomycetota bacterium]